MATHHASPGEIVDLKTWAQDLPGEGNKVIAKTEEMELMRLVLPAGRDIPSHKVQGPLVIHCITGEIELTAMGSTRMLAPDQLLYLMPGEPHSVRAISDSVFLLTVIFKS